MNALFAVPTSVEISAVRHVITTSLIFSKRAIIFPITNIPKSNAVVTRTLISIVTCKTLAELIGIVGANNDIGDGNVGGIRGNC